MKRCIQIVAFLLVLYPCTAQSPVPQIDSAWAVLKARLQGRLQAARQMKAQLLRYKKMEKELPVRMDISATALAKCLDSIISPDPAAVVRAYANNQQLSHAFSRILVTVEQHAELKATKPFLALLLKLEGAENQIHLTARRYNEVCSEHGRTDLQFIAHDGDRAPQVRFE
jgi:hypothetical protein